MIARVFRELGLMEEWGSGYSRIVNSCRSGGYLEPEWIELGSVMRVVFYPHPETSEERIDNVPVNQRQQWFINQIQSCENHLITTEVFP